MTTGASMVILEPGMITIELVGAGFDVGDLSRGKHAHLTFRAEALRATSGNRVRKTGFQQIFSIGGDDYAKSRLERLHELTTLHTGFEEEMHLSIPSGAPAIDNAIIEHSHQVYRRLASYAQKRGITSIGAMTNFYRLQPFVFEVYLPSRSMVTAG
jgi:hypothetical protein